MKLWLLLSAAGLAWAGSSSSSSSETSGSSSSGESSEAAKVGGIPGGGGTCTKMQLCIDKGVRKAWGRMYDQLQKFYDPTGECGEEVKSLHLQLGAALKVDKDRWRATVERVHDRMLARMEHVDEVVEGCMEAKGYIDGLSYCSDWRAPPAGKLSFITSAKCNKIEGYDFEATMDTCMRLHSDIFVGEARAQVYDDLAACQEEKIENVGLREHDKASEANLEKARKKREAIPDHKISINEYEGLLGREELETILKDAINPPVVEEDDDDVDDLD